MDPDNNVVHNFFKINNDVVPNFYVYVPKFIPHNCFLSLYKKSFLIFVYAFQSFYIMFFKKHIYSSCVSSFPNAKKFLGLFVWLFFLIKWPYYLFILNELHIYYLKASVGSSLPCVKYNHKKNKVVLDWFGLVKWPNQTDQTRRPYPPTILIQASKQVGSRWRVMQWSETPVHLNYGLSNGPSYKTPHSSGIVLTDVPL